MKELFFEDDCPYCGGKKMVEKMEAGYNWATYCLKCKRKIRDDRESMLKILREMWTFYKEENIPEKLKQVEEVANVVKTENMKIACQLYRKYNLNKRQTNPVNFSIYIKKKKEEK